MNHSYVEYPRIFAGIAVLTAIFFVGCLVLGQLSLPMVLGTLLGDLTAGLNFVLICQGAENLLDKTPGRARSSAVFGYLFRLAFTTVAIIFGYYADFINLIGVIVALFFPKITLIALCFLWKGGEK